LCVIAIILSPDIAGLGFLLITLIVLVYYFFFWSAAATKIPSFNQVVEMIGDFVGPYAVIGFTLLTVVLRLLVRGRPSKNSLQA
jgi:hypothetical protein